MSAPIFSVTAPNKVQYNIERASATAQKSLLMLIGARLTMISAQPSTPSDAMGKTEALIGMLMSLGESDFDKVAALVLPKVIKHGGDGLVTIDSFQGDMMSYMHIVVEAVRENLSDFFTWLQVQSKSDVTPPRQGKPPVTP